MGTFTGIGPLHLKPRFLAACSVRRVARELDRGCHGRERSKKMNGTGRESEGPLAALHVQSALDRRSTSANLEPGNAMPELGLSDQNLRDIVASISVHCDNGVGSSVSDEARRRLNLAVMNVVCPRSTPRRQSVRPCAHVARHLQPTRVPPVRGDTMILRIDKLAIEWRSRHHRHPEPHEQAF